MPDLDALINYYVQRLIWQYQKPRAQQTIAILVKQAVADGILWQIQDGYQLTTAIGAQLDVLGKYIGLPRRIGDAAPLPFFGFVDYLGGGNPNGFRNYNGTENSDVVFYQYGYNEQAATDLSDTAYLYMLLLKIALNTGDMTLYGIQQALLEVTDGKVRVVDNKNMTLTYYLNAELPVSASTITPYLPKPMGVGIAGVVVQNQLVTGTGDNLVTDTPDNLVTNNL